MELQAYYKLSEPGLWTVDAPPPEDTKLNVHRLALQLLRLRRSGLHAEESSQESPSMTAYSDDFAVGGTTAALAKKSRA